jgi:hypothetical protein
MGERKRGEAEMTQEGVVREESPTEHFKRWKEHKDSLKEGKSMVEREDNRAAMDENAKIAQKDLQDRIEAGTIDAGQFKRIAEWYKAHYLSAGYRRLGRIFINELNT